MIDWVVFFGLGIAISVCVFLFGHVIGRNTGWKRGWQAAKTLYARQEETAYVHYPADEKEAQEILERLEKSVEEAKNA